MSQTAAPQSTMSTISSFKAPQVTKRAKLAPLHEQYVAPKSFLVEAAEAKGFTIGAVGETFGREGEAYVRQCYAEVLNEIQKAWDKSAKEGQKSMLAVVQGSSGIGKSTFLAYLLAQSRANIKSFALFYAPKASKATNGIPSAEYIECVIWLDGKKIIDSLYGSVQNEVQKIIPKLSLIVMDGCSMPVSLALFTGAVIVAASPSLYVKNLEDEIFFHRYFTMPPADEEEAKAMAKIVGVTEEVVLENMTYMNGITRYLFAEGAAKAKVESAVKSVSASAITKMVSMQSSNKREEQFAVHSLVLWRQADGNCLNSPRFEMVSRYAEALVAKKLLQESMEDLKNARRSMSPLSGAEGYAGALFEAYAIRTFQEGGKFTMRCLDGTNRTEEISVPRLTTDPVVVETNKLVSALVSYISVRVSTSPGVWSPRLLWPTTTNFPTFDCFYFHTDGSVFPLQMTIATIHVLKNSGASNAKKYFDGMFGAGKPSKYPAVFVVPKDIAAGYTAQKFKGNVDQKSADLGPYFEQWVIGV